MNHKHEGHERRQHARVPIVDGVGEPITVKFDDPSAQTETQPAILTDLSAGGMSLLVFVEPPHAKQFDMVLTLPGLDHLKLEGKIVRVMQKGPTYRVGITFTQIPKKYQHLINAMAQDHTDCETRIGLRLPDACAPKCTFHLMCTKVQKAPHWPPK